MTHQDIHDLKKEYVDRLGKLLAWPKEQRWEFIHKLWPKIQDLDNENEDEGERYRVQMSELANIICAIMCADHNVEFHTGDEGVLQTLPTIGVCSATTSHFVPGYQLVKIEPEISFNGAIPVGAGVVMSTKLTRGEVGKRMLKFELRGHIEGQEGELFPEPRIITMFKIPDSL